MKKLLILFLISLLSIYMVNATVNIVESTLPVNGQQGTTKTASFTANNSGLTATNLAFTPTTLTKGASSLTVNPIGNVNLAANTINTVYFNVPITTNKPLGIYTGTISMTNVSSGTVLDTMAVNFNVTPFFSLNSTPLSIIFNDAQRNTTRTGVFTISNNGNGNLTNIVPGASFSSVYNVGFNDSGFDLNISQSKSLFFNITIPIDEPTTNHSIGSLVMTSNEFSQPVVDISVDINGGLSIDDFDVRIFYRFGVKDGDTDIIQNVINGQDLNFKEDVRPGSELRFNIDVINTFNSEDDIDIEDVTVTVTIDEIDDSEDLDEEGDEFDLEPGEEERTTLFFDIPLEVEEGDYDVLVEIEGTDTDGTSHLIIWNLQFTLNKERTSVIIRNAGLTSTTLSCNRNTRFNVGILNIGSKEQDDIKVEIKNEDLGVNFVEDGIDLDTEPFDDGDEYEKSLNINIPIGTPAGTYPIRTNVYLSSGALFHSKTVNLVLNECGSAVEEAPEEEEKEEENVSTTKPEGEEPDEIGSVLIPVLDGAVTESKESSSGIPIILSVVLAGIFAVIAGIFIALAIAPKK